MAQNLPCRECHGVTCENFSDDLEDCFEITDFHVQLEKGREILALHEIALRAAEIEPVMLQALKAMMRRSDPAWMRSGRSIKLSIQSPR